MSSRRKGLFLDREETGKTEGRQRELRGWLEPDLDTLPYQKSFELVQVKSQSVVTGIWQLKHRMYI